MKDADKQAQEKCSFRVQVMAKDQLRMVSSNYVT